MTLTIEICPMCKADEKVFCPRNVDAQCLECGQKHAQKEKDYKAKCTAPAYNKGAYQYVSTKAQVVGIFKCGSTK